MTTVERVAVALDLFPATVHVAGTAYSNVRAVIADGELRVYRLGGSGPEITYQRLVTGPLEGSIHTGVAVPTDAGEVWVEQGEGCGCGSELKVADLFPGQQRVMTGLR